MLPQWPQHGTLLPITGHDFHHQHFPRVLCTVLLTLSFCPFSGVPGEPKHSHWCPTGSNIGIHLLKSIQHEHLCREWALLLSFPLSCCIFVKPSEQLRSNLKRFPICAQDMSILTVVATGAISLEEAYALFTTRGIHRYRRPRRRRSLRLNGRARCRSSLWSFRRCSCLRLGL